MKHDTKCLDGIRHAHKSFLEKALRLPENQAYCDLRTPPKSLMHES